MSKETKNVKSEKTAKNGKPADNTKVKRSPAKWLREARSEFKKVVWPSRKQVIHDTSIVLTVLVVAGVALWGLDTAMESLFKLVLIKG